MHHRRSLAATTMAMCFAESLLTAIALCYLNISPYTLGVTILLVTLGLVVGPASLQAGSMRTQQIADHHRERNK